MRVGRKICERRKCPEKYLIIRIIIVVLLVKKIFIGREWKILHKNNRSNALFLYVEMMLR